MSWRLCRAISLLPTLLWVISLTPSGAHPEKETAGVITEIKTGRGRIEVRPAGSVEWRHAQPLQVLRVGDLVRATEDGRFVVMLSSQPKSVAVGAADELLQASLGFLSVRTEETPRVPLATRGLVPPEILTPRNGLVLPDRLIFEWLGSPFTPYTIRIVGQSGVVFERRSVTGAQLHYPPDAPRLSAGVRYTLQVLTTRYSVKEVWFEILHSDRAQAIQQDLAELERALSPKLFGHEKGAFTGAHQRKQGKLELAAGGTVFLDEIGEMRPALQAKLLRVLQEHAFERVGGTGTLQIDIRVITATNRDLTRAVQEGSFREDLFFRLNVIPITLPPLRDRKEDIPRLAEFFLKKHCLEIKKPGMRLAPDTLELLHQYDWPGNVRELENILERAVVLSGGVEIQPEEMAIPVLGPSSPPSAGSLYQARLESAEKDVLLQAMRDHGGDKRAAARALGLALSTFYVKLKKYQT